jgi:TIMELESS-interacting protein
VKLKGKGYERDDLNEVMKRLEFWSHRMFPKYHFDDSLTAIERLGRKKEISVHMSRYRLGQLLPENDEKMLMSDDEKDKNNLEDSLAQELPVDEFEEMLNQQIALSATHNKLNLTTASTSSQNNDTSFSNLSGISRIPSSTQNPINSTQKSSKDSQMNQSQMFDSLKESETSKQKSAVQLTDEQKKKIEENRQRAMAIRAAKLKEAEEMKRQKEKEQEEMKKQTEKEQTKHTIEIDDDFY